MYTLQLVLLFYNLVINCDAMTLTVYFLYLEIELNTHAG